MSPSLGTADQAGKHAAPPLLHWRSFDDTVVPKRSRDSVSGDVSFRRPAVELLVVTVYSWALPCHTKTSKRPGRSTSFELKFEGGVLGVSAHSVLFGTAEFINLIRSYSVFLVS